MNKCTERLYNGIIKENPTFILMLGMCPTLATTTSAINGLGMGLSTTAVLMFSNLIISLLRKIIPDRVRIPAFIVIVASLVTIVQLLMQGYVPSLYASLGIYIPLPSSLTAFWASPGGIQRRGNNYVRTFQVGKYQAQERQDRRHPRENYHKNFQGNHNCCPYGRRRSRRKYAFKTGFDKSEAEQCAER